MPNAIHKVDKGDDPNGCLSKRETFIDERGDQPFADNKRLLIRGGAREDEWRSFGMFGRNKGNGDAAGPNTYQMRQQMFSIGDDFWIENGNPAMHIIQAWPDQAALAAQISEAGWGQASWQNLTLGIVAIHRAIKPK